MTSENPNTPQQSETDHLKEALRSAEWQIEQQNKAFDSIERKAVQLITLYVVIIAFIVSFFISDSISDSISAFISSLISSFTSVFISNSISSSISSDIWSKDLENLTITLLFFLIVFPTLIILATLAILATLVFICSIALRPRPSEEADNNSIYFLQKTKDFNTMMQILLNDYVKRYGTNARVLRKKTKYYKISVIGGFFTLYFLCLGVLALYAAWETFLTST